MAGKTSDRTKLVSLESVVHIDVVCVMMWEGIYAIGWSGVEFYKPQLYGMGGFPNASNLQQQLNEPNNHTIKTSPVSRLDGSHD